MNDNLPIEAFTKFWEFHTTQSFDSAPLFPYEDFITDAAKTMGWIYDNMEWGYTQELINSLNRFSHEINTTIIWSEHILPQYSKEEQFDLSYYFLKLPLYYCLNQPQSIRDRIIFCSTHLSHQANLVRKIKNYKDDLPNDRKINKKELEKRLAHWSCKKLLLQSLTDIADKVYLEKTYNYRNMAHHRVPPSFEYGHTNFIKRLGYRESSFDYITFENGKEVKKTKTSKGVSYGFGGTPPLMAKDMIKLFKEQHCLLVKAFCNYWGMIVEHYEFSYNKKN